MTKVMENSPLVFLLDLDQTIQGDVHPQVTEYNLIDYLNNHNHVNVKKFTSKNRLPQNDEGVMDDMKRGLLRPYFKRFVVKMTRRYPNCEFFIYTASDTEWANYVVKVIQDTIKFKFNKRVFTRDDCIYDKQRGRYMKSIKHISPDIFKALKRKYKLKGIPETYQFEHIHLVDNSDVLYKPEQRYMIPCKDYNKRIVVDVLRSIPKSLVDNHYSMICNRLYGFSCDSLIEFYKVHYTHVHETQESTEKLNNIMYRKDKFWNKLLKELKSKYRLI